MCARWLSLSVARIFTAALAAFFVAATGFSTSLPERPTANGAQVALNNMLWAHKALTERAWAANMTPPMAGCRDVEAVKNDIKNLLPKYVMPGVDPEEWHNTSYTCLSGFQGGGPPSYIQVYRWWRPIANKAAFLSALALPGSFLDVTPWANATISATDWDALRGCISGLAKTVHDGTWADGVKLTYKEWENSEGEWESLQTNQNVYGQWPYTKARSAVWVYPNYCSNWVYYGSNNSYREYYTVYAHQQVMNLTPLLGGSVDYFTWIGTTFRHYGDGGFIPGNRARFNKWCTGTKDAGSNGAVSASSFGNTAAQTSSFPPYPTAECIVTDYLGGNNVLQPYAEYDANTWKPVLIDGCYAPCACTSFYFPFLNWAAGLTSDYYANGVNEKVAPYAVIAWKFSYP